MASGEHRMPWRAGLGLLATIALIGASSVVIWRGINLSGQRPQAAPPKQEIPSVAQPLDGAALLGSPTAPVAIIAYSDFQCPYCARFALQTMPELKKQFIDTGQAAVIFRHFPGTARHPLAEEAATVAVCAGQQGRFWEMHDALFGIQASLSSAEILRLATSLRLDGRTFQSCLASKPSIVREDAAAAKVLRITGTPTFLIGQRVNDVVHVKSVLRGAQPVAEFSAAIQAALANGPRVPGQAAGR